MFNSKDDINIVQQQRGRGNTTLKVVDKTGRETFVPQAEDNRHYRIVMEWLAEGGTLLDAPAKSVDPNRPTTTAYLPHPSFRLPDDDRLVVWRYLTPKKFRSLLDTSSLFFARGHVHRGKDEAEGTLSDLNLKADPLKVLQQVYGQPTGLPPDAFVQHRSLIESLGRYHFISCWNRSETESKEMWKAFADDPGAVAIKSSLGQLKLCFGEYTDYDVYIGEISYLDYASEGIDESNYFNVFLSKRRKFENEREIRCLIHDDGDMSIVPDHEPYDPFNQRNYPAKCFSNGICVPISLGVLVTNFVVSPEASRSRIEQVARCIEKHGLSAELVSASCIAE